MKPRKSKTELSPYLHLQKAVAVGYLTNLLFALAFASQVIPLRAAEPAVIAPEWTVGLQELDLGLMDQGWGTPQIDKSVSGQPLLIGGRKFTHGVGTHSIGEFSLDLHGTATRFSAWVGVDDGAQAPGSVTFQVVGDGRILWQSGVMLRGAPAKEVNVDLKDVKKLVLQVGDAGDGIGMDRADWAEAQIGGRSNKPVPSALDYRRTLDLSNPRVVGPVGKNSWGGLNPNGDRITVTSQSLELNGKPFIITAGELHPSRTDAEAWEESILKMKAGGLNTVSVYILWNHIEQDPGVFDFTGNRDFRRFVQLCAKHDMKVWLRVGPFCNAEALAGGLPQWLFGQPVEERSNDPGYLFYAERLYKEIGKQMHGLMFKDGGPVIVIQLENEYQHATPYWDFPYPGAGGGKMGSDGESHMMKLKALALQAGLDAPLFTVTAWGSPVPVGEFLPTWGCYAYLSGGGPTDTSTFIEGRNNPPGKFIGIYPFAFCELGGGSPPQAGWRPMIPPESVEVALFTRVACGGNLTDFYMYHGGMNPIGKHGYLNVAPGFATLSYDFQAPIGEFGRIKPSYYQLRPFQQFMLDFPDLLAPAVSVYPDKHVEATNIRDLRHMARVDGDHGFLFLNNYQDKLTLPDRTNVQVSLKLKDETVSIPDTDAGLTLKSGVMAALPFNLPLDGTRLKYATAQLMCKVDTGNERTLVFFAPKGMATEYVFDAATVKDVQGVQAVRLGNTLRIGVLEPGTGAKFKVTPVSGKPFSILTLTRHQAEHCLKLRDLWGAERLVLSDDDVICDGKSLRVSSVGNENLSFAVFPNPARKMSGPTGELTGVADGIFTRYEVNLPKREVKAEIKKVADDKVLVKVPRAEFKNINDIFLQVDYTGDRGWAFLDGTLVADNYSLGVPWELGLKRWQADVAEKGLFVRIVPWKGDTSKILFDGITFKPVDGVQGSAVGFKSVRLVPEYVAEIR